MKLIIKSKNSVSMSFFLVLLMVAGCESFVEVNNPKIEIISESVYADDVSATSAIRGIYHEMIRSGFASGSSSSVTFLAGLSSDEFRSQTSSLNEFYNNSISPSNSIVRSEQWSSMYKIIYYTNSSIEGITASTTLSATMKKQLLGEAKFLRAFCYFYLTNLFGDVPLILSTSYVNNSTISKSSSVDVYARIVMDLTEAQSLLIEDYQLFGGERVRANKWVATALLSRVYLFQGDWTNAETQASSIISNTPLFNLLTDLNTVFLKNSKESIWQLMPVANLANTTEGQNFIPASATAVPLFVSITPSLVGSFESGDKRRTNWIGSSVVSGNTFYYPFKYKINKTGQPLTEYSMVFRLSEQFLIRAEARAMQSKYIDAIIDINLIRQRAGLPAIVTAPVPTTDDLKAFIIQERKVEFFSEWGHRWFDLKRLKLADNVLQPLKPTWKPTSVLFPIPQVELASDPNLNPQNPGY